MFKGLFYAVLLTLSPASILLANCPEPDAHKAPVQSVASNGWGFGPANQRYQDSSATTLTAANVGGLTLRWAFALPDNTQPHSYPLVTAERIYIGSQQGLIYALDKDSGCVIWAFEADGDIRGALSMATLPAVANGQPQAAQITAYSVLLFSTSAGSVYAVSAQDGKEVWRVSVGDHPQTMLTGSVLYHNGRLYVPVSSYEMVLAAVPLFSCCTFRGSVVALDAATGEQLWETFTIAEPAKVTGHNFGIIKKWGPSGAPVWSTPTIDVERNLLFIGTGENYTDPTTDTSDSILALDLDSGTLRWSRQLTERDAWNFSCELGLIDSNCPQSNGPDFDFGAAPILVTNKSGEDLLLAGQKSGMVYGLKPATGELLWQTRLGRGGKLGGVHWGMAVNPVTKLLFVPISDRGSDFFNSLRTEGAARPGLHAVDIATGKWRWSTIHENTCGDREECFSGLSAAITASSELVFAGALDGMIRAYRASSGEVLWQYDSWRDFTAVNGGQARGGSIDVHGPLLAGDMLLITSGYGTFGQRSGNALLAFSLP